MIHEEQARKLVEPYGISGHDIDPGFNEPTYITIYDAVTLLMTQLELLAEKDKRIGELVQPKWISVKERLPEKMEYYVCMMGVEPDMGTRIEICFYAIREEGSMAVEKTGWGVPRLYPWATHEVTHWMPLPEPPKGEL